MSIFDGLKAKEQEKKVKNKKELLQEQEATLDFQKSQKRIREKIKTKEALDMLKELVDAWFLTQESVEKFSWWERLSTKEVKEILEKITELQTLETSHKLLPKQLIISPEEYLEALWDFEKKKALLQKIDQALDTIYMNMGSGFIFSVFSFLSYNLFLSQNVRQIQWNLIDIKNDILTTNTL